MCGLMIARKMSRSGYPACTLTIPRLRWEYHTGTLGCKLGSILVDEPMELAYDIGAKAHSSTLPS